MKYVNFPHKAHLVLTVALGILFFLPLGLVQAQPAIAPTAAPPTIEEFVRRPQYTEMLASPSGRYLATTREISGRLNLVIIDLEKRSSFGVTNFDDIDVGPPMMAAAARDR